MANDSQRDEVVEHQPVSKVSLEIQRQLQEAIGNRSRLWIEFDQAKSCGHRLGQISPYPDVLQLESQRSLSAGQNPLTELSLMESTIEQEQNRIKRLEQTLVELKAHISALEGIPITLMLLGIVIVTSIGLWYVGYFVQVVLGLIVLFFIYAGIKK